MCAAAGAAVLTIVDSGPGIDDELRRRLFEPFSAGSTASGRAGAGLGLAICQEVVRSLGGDIRLDNQRAGGLQARVRLPIQPDAARGPSATGLAAVEAR